MPSVASLLSVLPLVLTVLVESSGVVEAADVSVTWLRTLINVHSTVEMKCFSCSLEQVKLDKSWTTEDLKLRATELNK